MQKGSILDNVVFRNAVGFGALVGVHLLADHTNMVQRTGINKIAPYFFLLLMYGWIVIHNRVLFERLFLRDRKLAYYGWTLLAMVMWSLNMHYILLTGFRVSNTLPHIISFWLYTVAGLGVFVIWRYARHIGSRHEPQAVPAAEETDKEENPQVFSCMIDGFPKEIRYDDIQYIESMENYIRIVTNKKPLIVRISLKDTELRLPAPPFIRISRSCIVNSNHIEGKVGETLRIHGNELKVGKVFKRYVEKFLK